MHHSDRAVSRDLNQDVYQIDWLMYSFQIFSCNSLTKKIIFPNPMIVCSNFSYFPVISLFTYVINTGRWSALSQREGKLKKNCFFTLVFYVFLLVQTFIWRIFFPSFRLLSAFGQKLFVNFFRDVKSVL